MPKMESSKGTDRKSFAENSVELSLDGTTVSDSNSTSSDLPHSDGERGLLQQLEEKAADNQHHLPSTVVRTLQRSLSNVLTIPQQPDSVYRQPLTVEEASILIMQPDEDGSKGLGWYATIVPDEFVVDGKLRPGLSAKDFDIEKKLIKPRRASIPVQSSDFFGSLTKIKGEKGPRHIFHGILNGWPGLRCFEVEQLEEMRKGIGPMGLLGKHKWNILWTAEKDGAEGTPLQISDSSSVHRAKLRAAPWSAKGWSKESLGYAFWFEAQLETPRLSYGTDIISSVTNDVCTAIHMVSHRYAKEHESPRDKLTYHSLALLEWEHGQYCSVLEAAYLNGIGGYRGMCNWYDDRDEPTTALYRALPPEMIAPWRETSAELRCYDIPAKNFEEFKHFVSKYEGPSKRFLDPHYLSFPARLTFRRKQHIAQYLINYILRDSTYTVLARNCQTFCADLCSFIAGKRNVPPFHPVNRVEYVNQTHLFLYDSHLYQNNRDGKSKKKTLLSSFR